MSNILLLLAHAIEEYDQVRLLSELGYEVFSIGAYTNPSSPDVDIRPSLPQVRYHPELEAACVAQRAKHPAILGPGVTGTVDMVTTPDGPRPPIDWAKADLSQDVIDWADVVICHHFEHTWIVPQWGRLKHKRVIWRTVGQSVEHNEKMMAPLHEDGLQIVRYSPKEQNIPGYCGEDALIRFYKDPDEWSGWTGENRLVVNFTQNFRDRHPYTNWNFWVEAVQGLPATTFGPGSDVGEVSCEAMKDILRSSRAYLYCGTQPASYTLGLIEAMMVGIPIVSIGPSWANVFSYGPLLFEGHEIIGDGQWSNSAFRAGKMLQRLLDDDDYAAAVSKAQRERAIELFGKAKIAAEWKSFLGVA